MATKKITGDEQVVRFMDSLDHPLKEHIEKVRNIILNAGVPLTQHIKWNAPSFCFEGEDKITFNLQGKGFFRLIFHCGAKAKDVKVKDKLADDSFGILEWVANDRAIVLFNNMEEINSKEGSLKEVVKKWIQATGKLE